MNLNVSFSIKRQITRNILKVVTVTAGTEKTVDSIKVLKASTGKTVAPSSIDILSLKKQKRKEMK